MEKWEECEAGWLASQSETPTGQICWGQVAVPWATTPPLGPTASIRASHCCWSCPYHEMLPLSALPLPHSLCRRPDRALTVAWWEPAAGCEGTGPAGVCTLSPRKVASASRFVFSSRGFSSSSFCLLLVPEFLIHLAFGPSRDLGLLFFGMATRFSRCHVKNYPSPSPPSAHGVLKRHPLNVWPLIRVWIDRCICRFSVLFHWPIYLCTSSQLCI